MAKERIAILGGKGMLGSDLVLACQRHQFTTTVFDLPEFDIRNENHLAETLKKVDTVVNCAAYTDVDKAENQADLAYQVNAEAVGRLGCLAKETGMWVLHISTDFVFDGESDKPYVETDTTNPVNVYGKSKLAGEQFLSQSGCRYCIIRLEWTYGAGGNNFVTKLIQKAKTNKKINVVDDQTGSPTATTEIAEVICELLRKTPQGLFHYASAGYVSRFEMAKFIFDTLNISTDTDLSPCKTSDYKTLAKRPLNSRFSCDKIQVLLDEPIPKWDKSLRKFLGQL